MSRMLKIAIPVLLIGLVAAVSFALLSATSKGGSTDAIGKLATGSLQKLDVSGRGAMASGAAFEGPDGSQMTLADLSGKVTLVNFWATWCGPCEREMPSLAALESQKGGADFQVIAISVDATEVDANCFLISCVGLGIVVVRLCIHATGVQTATIIHIGSNVVVICIGIHTTGIQACSVVGIGTGVIVVGVRFGATEVNTQGFLVTGVGLGIIVIRFRIHAARVQAATVFHVGASVVVVGVRIHATEVLT